MARSVQSATRVVGVVQAWRCSVKMTIELEQKGARSASGASREMVEKMLRQIGASVFFGVSSVLIITVNKTVLTTYKLVQVSARANSPINAQSYLINNNITKELIYTSCLSLYICICLYCYTRL